MRASGPRHTTLRLPLGPRVAAPAARAASVVALAFVAAAVAVALAPWGVGPRSAGAIGLVVAAALAHRTLSRRRRPPAGWLSVEGQALRRPGEPAIVEWREPFGVTVLANVDRSRLVLVFTSPRATRLLAVRVVDPGDAAEAPTLFDRAVTAVASDLPVDEAGALCAADAERLLVEVARRAPGALDRIYLSDASGEPVVLDREELRVGDRRIDLSAPLEWRPFLFQEPGAQAAALCQATWVRQGDGEIVLVAPMLDDTASLRSAPDARLLQAPVGDPPPRELRCAIDRVFMFPLRRALDRAPRASRAPSSPRPRRGWGRPQA